MIYYEQKVEQCGAGVQFSGRDANFTVNWSLGQLYRRRVNFFTNVQYHRVRSPRLFLIPAEQFVTVGGTI